MLLSFRSVHKRFIKTVALSNVTCDIDGRAVGLLGPNGAGKTTLMRICLGLLPADRGTVHVLGLDARRQPREVRMRLGYAAEGPDRIPGLTGLESVAYTGELCGLGRRHALLRAHEMLDLVGLDEARHRAVETYSTGMHQRVKIAMALVHDPELVLLDEPTSGLDPGSRDEILELLNQLRQGDGPAVLLSTHLLHDVERTCDACIIMHEGSVRFAGPLADLRPRLRHEYEVRTRGDTGPFCQALAKTGAEVKAGRRADVLIVRLASDDDTTPIWDAARRTSTLVWHMERRAQSLEEAFLDRIADAGGES